MRTLRLSLAGTVVLALLAGLGGVVAGDEEAPVRVTFYHTADLHESGERLARIAALVESRKDEDTNVLFVDSGDWFRKGDLTPLETRGEAVTAMLGASDYDAMTLGNNEHVFGTERLSELIDRFALPVVAANVGWPEDLEPEHVVSHRIFDLDGVTVAIIGAAAACDSGNTSRCLDDLVDVLPIEESIGDLVATLEERVDIIVLLTHQGSWRNKQLAQAFPEVDVIFGGHSHERFDSLVVADGTDTIVQHSGGYGYWLGELTITWDGEQIIEPQLRMVWVADELPVSDPVEAIRQEYVSQAQ